MLRLARRILPEPIKEVGRRLRESLAGETPQYIDRLVLAAARRNLSAASTLTNLRLPDLGRRWGGYAAWIRENIETFRSIVAALQFAQMQVGFEMRAMPPQGPAMVAAQLGHMRACYPGFSKALEASGESMLSEHSHPGPVVRIENARYTTSHLSIVEHMFYIANRLGRLPGSVLEIGGGYGAPARAWLTCNLGRMRRFAILDLPESLFFAEVFLKAHFGLEGVVNLVDSASLARAEHACVILCPLQNMGLMKSFDFDVVINTGSMQEMTDDWITTYADFLSDLNASYFYSANHFLQPLDRLNESMNLWSPRVKADWSLEDLDYFPATAESDFRSGLRAFYKHEAAAEVPLQSATESIARFETRSPGEPITQQEGRDLALLMDAFRRGLPPALVVRLARALRSACPFVVKETGFIVAWVLSRKSDLTPSDAAEMEAFHSELTRRRAAGNEGLV